MEKKYVFIYTCLLLALWESSAFSQTKVIPFQQLPTSTGSLSGSGMYFGATMTPSNITITFEGPADRWIAFGFSTMMSPADMFIYSNGQVTAPNPLGWEDYYNGLTAATFVLMDTIQNWNVISTGTVAPGQRTVTASRALSTGDVNYDVILSYSAAALDLIWARGATADYTLAYHGGTNRANGISLPWLSPPTASFVVASNTVCQGSPTTFSNVSTGGLTTYTWAFDSGSPAVSNATNVAVTYTAPGTYSVSLMASNIFGVDTLTKINYITVTPTVATALSIGAAPATNTSCQGATVTFTSTSANGGTAPSYQWKVNGVNAGSNSTSLSTNLFSNSSVYCVMTSNLGCARPPSITSPTLNMTVYSNAPAYVSASITGGSNPLCIGDLETFAAVATNGGSNPIFQWRVNGQNVGSNSPSFSTNNLANGDTVICILTSNQVCASATLVSTSPLTMSVSSLLTPSVSVILSGGANPSCVGAPITVTAAAVNGGNSPAFQWQVNGLNVGSNSDSYTSSGLNSGDVINCIMTSGLSCASPSVASSSATTFTVNPVPPTPVVTASGPTSICQGESVLLSSSGQFVNTWSNGANTSSILVTSSGNYTVTQTANGCVSLPSLMVPVVIHPLPVVSMQSISAICLSSGTFVLVQGSPSGGIYSGPGVSGLIFDPGLSGLGKFPITYAYTDANNCSDSASILLTIDDCLSIKKTEANPGLSIFPNPTNGEFTVYSVKDKIISVSITDMSGRIVAKKSGRDEDRLLFDLSEQAPGIYMLTVILEKGTVYSKISKRD